MDNYYRKYLKYKIKYLELKGGKLEYGLYGLFSYIGEQKNLRESNSRINEKNYIHDLPLELDDDQDNLIIRHLLSHCTIEDGNIKYYTGIKSFEFVPYKDDDPDIKEIQKIIDITYFTESFKDRNPKWTELNKIKKNRNLGMTTELSEEIHNMYAEKAKTVLDSKTYFKDSLPQDLLELRKTALDLQSKRTCDQIHNHPNPPSSDQSESILFEDILIDEKQMLLSNVVTGLKYLSNPNIHLDPFTLVNEKLSYLSWNLIINKTTLSCLVKYHDVLFPIRIVLSEGSSELFTDNIFEKEEKYQNYKGFFIIRFDNDEDITTKYSKPHDSKEQYYIFFIFKNENPFFDNPLYNYTLTNFRNNIVIWGTVIEKKTVLYYEIIQLLCLYRNKNCYFYILINKDKTTEFHNNKKLKDWFYPNDLQHISLFNNEIHILVSKDKIEDVSMRLTGEYPFIIQDTTIKIIDHPEFTLLNCHFAWYAINGKDTFCIKLGDIKQNLLPYYNVCIEHRDSEIFRKDIDRYTEAIGQLNKTDFDNIDEYKVLYV
jgi:hypothetical protein